MYIDLGSTSGLLHTRAREVGLDLPENLATRLLAYYGLLAHWNERINLTALPLDNPTPASVDRLLLEPLCAAAKVLDDQEVWFDFGSGGGSPAIPMKLLRPETQLTMVESRSKKAAFLREAIRELKLTKTEVVEERFEELGGPVESQASAVTARAVSPDSRLFAAAAGLLRPGGKLILFGVTADLAPTASFGPGVPVGLFSRSVLHVFERA